MNLDGLRRCSSRRKPVERINRIFSQHYIICHFQALMEWCNNFVNKKKRGGQKTAPQLNGKC